MPHDAAATTHRAAAQAADGVGRLESQVESRPWGERTDRLQQDAGLADIDGEAPQPLCLIPTPPTLDAPDTDVDYPDVDAVARYFVRRFGTVAVDVDFGDCDESTRFIEIVPRSHDGQAEHTRWRSALEALDTKHSLTFEEFDAIESAANGEAISSLEEGYVFGLAVGRQLRAEDVPRREEGDELAALQAVTGKTANETPTPEPDPDGQTELGEPGGERTAQPAGAR